MNLDSLSIPPTSHTLPAKSGPLPDALESFPGSKIVCACTAVELLVNLPPLSKIPNISDCADIRDGNHSTHFLPGGYQSVTPFSVPDVRRHLLPSGKGSQGNCHSKLRFFTK